MLNPNTIIGGRYRVVKLVGGGGMKLVYLAEDMRLSARRCALAEMVDTFTNPDMQRQAVAAFQREADMLAQLNNEHIPRIFDRFSEQNHHYLVMEYVDGITLEDATKAAGGRLDEARIVEIALQVLDTLIYLHALSPPVVYRDLKPSNVMLMSNGQAKLIDFGIARHFMPQSNATMIGTQGYAPPEQYRGKAETRSDLYALGATMHHALSGRDPTTEPPFSFPPLRQAAPGVTPALADLVDWSLSYDLVNRIPDAAEFKRRLMEIKAVLSARPGAAPILLSSQAQANASPASTSAPTILGTPSEIRCSGCTRYVPADSKYCSFCATDLRWVLGGGDAVSSHEADTAGLSEPPPFRVHPVADAYHERRHRRRRFAFRAVTVIALFFGAYLGMKFLSSLASNQDTAPPDGSIAPGPYPYGGAPAPYPGAPAPEAGEPPHTTMREVMLRRWLNQMGYSAVHFRVDGDTVQLWGTVRTPWDRMVVQQTVSALTGFLSIEDHLKVQEDEFGYRGP